MDPIYDNAQQHHLAVSIGLGENDMDISLVNPQQNAVSCVADTATSEIRSAGGVVFPTSSLRSTLVNPPASTNSSAITTINYAAWINEADEMSDSWHSPLLVTIPFVRVPKTHADRHSSTRVAFELSLATLPDYIQEFAKRSQFYAEEIEMSSRRIQRCFLTPDGHHHNTLPVPRLGSEPPIPLQIRGHRPEDLYHALCAFVQRPEWRISQHQRQARARFQALYMENSSESKPLNEDLLWDFLVALDIYFYAGQLTQVPDHHNGPMFMGRDCFHYGNREMAVLAWENSAYDVLKSNFGLRGAKSTAPNNIYQHGRRVEVVEIWLIANRTAWDPGDAQTQMPLINLLETLTHEMTHAYFTFSTQCRITDYHKHTRPEFLGISGHGLLFVNALELVRKVIRCWPGPGMSTFGTDQDVNRFDVRQSARQNIKGQWLLLQSRTLGHG